MTAMSAPAESAPAENVVSMLDANALERVRVLIFDASGIVLGNNKVSMVQARLSKRLIATGHDHIGTYLDFLEKADDGTERNNLVSAMTTNVTHFFREAHHFNHLRNIALDARATGRRLQIWSAGCSSGQESYSIAMTLAEAGLGPSDVRILATDIDRQILRLASAATYSQRDVETIPPAHRGRGIIHEGDEARIAPEIRSMVDFKVLNLIGSWPFRTQFDVIFCRNVAIYFDPPTQETLWSRMIQVLQPEGCLFMGHSERLPESLLSKVRYAGQTTYNKIDPRAANKMSIKDQIHILVVDDMSTSRGLIIQALESMGISHIHHAADGIEALAVMASRPVHMVLSDYNMPGMDGMELLKKIRTNPKTKGTGFILITGRADKELVDSGRAMGMNNFIKKPFTPVELKSCLEAVVGRL